MTQPDNETSKLADNQNGDWAARYSEVLRRESAAILAAANREDPGVARAIDLLFHCQGRLIFSGMGKMGFIARKAAATFSSTGSPAIFLHPGEAVHGDLGIVTPADILIAISNSGETNELLDLMPFMKRHEVPVVAVSGNLNSSLAKYADIVIDSHVDQEADPESVAPTNSTAVAMAICDGLAVSLMQRRGFSKEQFAIFHPGGQLGRKLLLKVCDLMQGEEEIPFVLEEATLSDAVKSISEKSKGAAFIVDDSKKLLGVLTDGDVRRIFESTASNDENQNPLSENVRQFMTANPVSVSLDALAAEALSLMEDHQISVMPVIVCESQPKSDSGSKKRSALDKGTIVGVIHLHDLIRSGLA